MVRRFRGKVCLTAGALRAGGISDGERFDSQLRYFEMHAVWDRA